MKIDPELAKIFKKYGGDPEKDLWNCHGTFVAYHKALSRIAIQAGITFEMPCVIESNLTENTIAVCVRGTMGDREEWSIGEASPGNNKNSYPAAMAEKRAKDRVILLLLGLHGHIYSEEEADDFKKPSAFQARKDEDYPKLEKEIRACDSLAALEKFWRENSSRIQALPAQWITHITEEKDRKKEELA